MGLNEVIGASCDIEGRPLRDCFGNLLDGQRYLPSMLDFTAVRVSQFLILAAALVSSF